MYVYIQSERELWTVGHYDPDGDWIAESDHTRPEDAARRVHYLNGGTTEHVMDRPDLPDVTQLPEGQQ